VGPTRFTTREPPITRLARSSVSRHERVTARLALAPSRALLRSAGLEILAQSVCTLGTLTHCLRPRVRTAGLCFSFLASASPPRRTRAVGQEDGHRELSLVSEKSSPGEGAMTSVLAPPSPSVLSLCIFIHPTTCRLWRPGPETLRSSPRVLKEAMYAGCWIWTSENTTFQAPG
jgi:hypothetical protein